MDNQHLDFETWEAKKLQIFAKFSSLTDEMEITVSDPSKKSVNQKIAVKGKDRTAQIADPENTYSARDFTTQLERIDKEMIKFWEKDDKVGAIRIAI